MDRLAIFVMVCVLTASYVSADVITLDQPCASDAQITISGTSKNVEEWISGDPEKFNCFDVACGVVADGAIVKVSDGTNDASVGTALVGQASYLTTDIESLDHVRGECVTPTFEDHYCSARTGSWQAVVGLARHFDRAADSGDLSDSWPPELKNEQPSGIGGIQTESVTRRDSTGYSCSDRLAPSVSYERTYLNLLTGERTLRIVFDDNETSYGPNDVNILMDGYSDTTTLEECRYMIVQDASPTGEWVDVDCGGKHKQVVSDIETGGLDNGWYLHLWARDTEGNVANEPYRLLDLYPALDDEGYCPRPDNCLVYPAGTTDAQLGNSTFDEYIKSGDIPACVDIGEAVMNTYCSERGTIERSETLFTYGISQLDRAGVVYCGYESIITGTGTEATIPTALLGPNQEKETQTCIIAYDNDPAEWQSAAAIFTSNNFLNGAPEIYAPETFVRRFGQTIGTDRFNLSSCITSGDTLTCELELLIPNGALPATATLHYHNESGISSISQTTDLEAPTRALIEAGYATLTAAPFTEVTSSMNEFLDDVYAFEANTDYDIVSLQDSTRISAYRTNGNKRIIGLTGRIKATETTKTLYAVAVQYEGFTNDERTFIDAAKDGLTRTNHIRTSESDGEASIADGSNVLQSYKGGSTITVIATADSLAHAHRIIEQLVVRPRIQ